MKALVDSTQINDLNAAVDEMKKRMVIAAQVKVGSDWREVDEQCDNM